MVRIDKFENDNEILGQIYPFCEWTNIDAYMRYNGNSTKNSY